MGNLVIIASSFLVVLGVISLALVGLAIYCFHQRKRAAGIPLAVLSLVLIASTAADAVNVHYSYFPRLNDLFGVPTWNTKRLTKSGDVGQVITTRIDSTNYSFRASKAFIYLPSQYVTEPQRRFPVIYMLHGSPGVPVDWFRAANAADVGDSLARDGHPAILVAPSVSRSWLDDSECVNRPNERIEDYVVQRVIPTIDAGYRTSTSRDDRTVTGMSAGGFCALNIGLKHSDLFGHIIDMSGYDRPTHKDGMKGLFGNDANVVVETSANSPLSYLGHGPLTRPQSIWLDYGLGDEASALQAKEVKPLLEREGITVSVHSRPGSHNYNVWRPAMRESFPSVSGQRPGSAG